jgi:integrase
MAKTIGRLTAQQVESPALEPRRHSDGGNLYLDVRSDGGRSWLFIYRWQGKQREAGLGKAGKGAVPLKDARQMAKQGRALLDQRPPVDPLSVWRAAPEKRAPTFAEASANYLSLHEPSWKNAKHAQQWRNTLASYCRPIHKLPVDQIGAEDVLAVLRPIWRQAPETASRLRGRIETILDFAKVDDAKPNPARWKGHLAFKLPNPNAIGKRVKRNGVIATVDRGHFAALPYVEVPNFLTRLRLMDGVAAKALEFLILTAGRTSEVLGARWSELNLDATTWTVPAERLKTGKLTRRPHVVPLSDRALAIIAEMGDIRSSDYLFPGRSGGKPLSNMALLTLLKKRMDLRVTAHGFRSSFRDWAGDATSFPREVCEQALGHLVGGVEGAYRRGDALGKRRKLMDAWAAYCKSPPPSDETAANNVLLFESISARAV